jgi:ATP-dependent protease Clp ATPase subunit
MVTLFFKDIKSVIKSRKSKKDIQYNDQKQKKKDKRTNNNLQTLHRELNIEQHEPH